MENYMVLKIIKEMQKNIKNLVYMTLIFILIFNVISLCFFKNEYLTESKVFVGKQKFKSEDNSYSSDEIILYQRIMKTYQEIITTKKFINKSLENVKTKKSVEDILNNLNVSAIDGTQIMSIKYKDKNMQQSYDICYMVSENFIKSANELYANSNIVVISQPDTVLVKKNFDFIIATILGLITGLMSSALYIVLKEYIKCTVNSKKDVEDTFNIPCIGVIPNENQKFYQYK